MKQWQRILAVFAASAGLGLVVTASPLAVAADAPKNLVVKADAKDLILKGDAKCTGCHDEADEPTGAATMLELNPSVLAIAKSRHGVKADGRTPTCTDCHGESDKHRLHKGSDKPPKVDRSFRKNTATSAEERSDACLTCHKGDKRSHWDGSQHASRDVACNSCHKVHTQNDKVMSKKTQPEVCYACHKTERAQSHRMSTHPIAAGKMTCSDCHNAHGSTGPKLLTKNTVNETCYTCHAEKRGPFLHEHQPVNDDCLTCHTPHGSPNLSLLKARQPYLCQECHQDHGRQLFSSAQVANGPGSPALGVSVNATTGLAGKQLSIQGNGRMCGNCHSVIHGSNAPNGGFFNR
jgi:DmsE family decaheme c-type cytochrome